VWQGVLRSLSHYSIGQVIVARSAGEEAYETSQARCPIMTPHKP